MQNFVIVIIADHVMDVLNHAEIVKVRAVGDSISNIKASKCSGRFQA